MKKSNWFLIWPLILLVVPAFSQQPKYPFNDPNLSADKRIDNLLSLMTPDEKIDCLGTQTGVPRL
jgi:beta-glucosidase